jgi:hypothetical protein
MRQEILIHLFNVNRASAGEIAQVTGNSPREVQKLLIQMDDDGEVLMRCGYYRLSAYSLSQATKSFDDEAI